MKSLALNTAILVLILASLAIILLNNSQPQQQSPQSTDQVKHDQPEIISTKPDPLEEAVVSATEQIEITFSHPLENSDQAKFRLEPKVDYKIVLSQDRKTAKIVPQKPYDLGSTYTLFILPDSKFDGIGQWGKEKIFHFKTIKYRGV